MSLRHTLMSLLTTTQDIDIYDPTSINWKTFSWSRGYYTHSLTEIEILKPYLISYSYYETVAYEEIILLLNGIQDIWAVVPGTEIRIPKLDDLRNFLIKNKK